MGLLDVTKILFLPALIAAGLYALLAYALLPLYRRHRERYRQYLPLDTLSQRTSSLRDRCTDAVVRFIVARRSRHAVAVEDASSSAEESSANATTPGRGGHRGRGRASSEADDDGDGDAIFSEDAERMLGFGLSRSERERVSPRGMFRS